MPKKIAPAFFFIGNHPILDFVNTKIAVDQEPLDLLGDYSELLDWMCKAELLNQADVVRYEQRWGKGNEGELILSAARDLRSSVLTIIKKIKNEENCTKEYLEIINRLLKEQVVTAELIVNNNVFEIEKQVRVQNPLEMLIPIAEAAVDFFSHYSIDLVKKCENPKCVLYFYDNSKNSTRRWCSQKTCGNRMKVTAYLERQRNK